MPFGFKKWQGPDPRKLLLDSVLFPKGEKPRIEITTKSVTQIFLHYAKIVLPHIKKEISINKAFSNKREAESALSILAYHHLNCNSSLKHPDIEIKDDTSTLKL